MKKPAPSSAIVPARSTSSPSSQRAGTVAGDVVVGKLTVPDAECPTCATCGQRKPHVITFPLAPVHAGAARYGGMAMIVEGLAEMLPGVRFDKPETIPPPIRALMRALRKKTPFAIVIDVDARAWRVVLQ